MLWQSKFKENKIIWIKSKFLVLLIILFFLCHNIIIMIYLVSILSGVINGLFAAAAGQIMIFYLVFILKKDAHTSRATCIFCISLVTIISLIGYIKIAKFKMYQVITVIICGLIFGVIGSKIMNKINSNYLNLLSGVIIFGLSIYKLFVK